MHIVRFPDKKKLKLSDGIKMLLEMILEDEKGYEEYANLENLVIMGRNANNETFYYLLDPKNVFTEIGIIDTVKAELTMAYLKALHEGNDL